MYNKRWRRCRRNAQAVPAPSSITRRKKKVEVDVPDPNVHLHKFTKNNKLRKIWLKQIQKGSNIHQ